jgi:hypothetical protein
MHEYGSDALPKEWRSLDRPCVVRYRGGLAVAPESEIRERYADIILDAASRTNAQRLVEFGCGEGLNIGVMSARSKLSFSGFDLVPARIDRAREHFRTAGIEADLWVGNATESQGRTFDLAYSVHAIEQMQDGWLDAIRRMKESASHILLIEPFFERKDVHGKLHTLSKGYFRGRIADVLDLGLSIEREYQLEFADPWNRSTAILFKAASAA